MKFLKLCSKELNFAIPSLNESRDTFSLYMCKKNFTFVVVEIAKFLQKLGIHHCFTDSSIIYLLFLSQNSISFIQFKFDDLDKLSHLKDQEEFTPHNDILSINKYIKPQSLIHKKLNIKINSILGSPFIRILKTDTIKNNYVYAAVWIENSISVINVRNDIGSISLKNYKISGFSINKILGVEIHEDFTGENYEIVASVYHDKNDNSLLSLQKILLPNLEKEIILNHTALHFLVSKYFHKLQVIKWKTNENFIVLFTNNNLIIMDGSLKIHSEFSLHDYLQDNFTDYFKITVVNDILYLFVLANAQILYTFIIQNNLSSFQYVSSVKLELNGIPLDYKIFEFEGEIIIFNVFQSNKIFMNKLKISEKGNKVEFGRLGDSNMDLAYKFTNRKKIQISKILMYDKDSSMLSKFSQELEIIEINKKHSEIITIKSQFKMNKFNSIDLSKILTKQLQIDYILPDMSLVLLKLKDNQINILNFSSDKIIFQDETEINSLLRIIIGRNNVNFYLIYSNGLKLIDTKGEILFTYKFKDYLLEVIENVLEKKMYLIFNNFLFVISSGDNKPIEISHEYDFQNCDFAIFENICCTYSQTKSLEFFLVINNCIEKFSIQKLSVDEINQIDQVFITKNFICIVKENLVHNFKYHHKEKKLEVEKFNIFELFNFKGTNLKIVELDESLMFYLTTKHQYLEYMVINNNREVKLLLLENNMKISHNNIIYSINEEKLRYLDNIKAIELSKSLKSINSTVLSFYNRIVKSIKSVSPYTSIYLKSGYVTSEEIERYYLIVYNNISNCHSPVMEISLDSPLLDFEYVTFLNSILILALVYDKDTKNINILILKIDSKNMLTNSLFSDMTKSNQEKIVDNFDNFDIHINKSDNSEYEISREALYKLDSNFLGTKLKLIDQNKIIVTSKYGSLKIFEYDEYCDFNEFYSSNFSSHLVEISKLKNEYANREDLESIFIQDLELEFLETYEFFDGTVFMIKDQVGNKNEFPIIEEKFYILIFNFGLLILQVKTDTFTDYSIAKFYQQVSFENKIKSLIEITKEEEKIKLETNLGKFKIVISNKKFSITID